MDVLYADNYIEREITGSRLLTVVNTLTNLALDTAPTI